MHLTLPLRHWRIQAKDENNLLVCDLVHEEDLVFATDESILDCVRRLRAYSTTCSKADFEMRQQGSGFRHEPNGLLLDDQLQLCLRPASQYSHDWMHGIFVSGVFFENGVLYFVSICFARMHICRCLQHFASSDIGGVRDGWLDCLFLA